MAGFFNEFIADVVDAAAKELTRPKHRRWRRRRKSTTLRRKVTSTLEKALIEAVLGEKTTTRKTKTKRLAKRAGARTRTKRRTTRKTARRTS